MTRRRRNERRRLVRRLRIAAGLVIGRLAGGRVANLEQIRFVWWPLALLGFGVQLVLFFGPVQERIGAEGPVIYVLSTLAVLVALLRNLRLTGLPILAAGAILNLIPILANGGYMPSSPEAWEAITGSAALPAAHYSNVVLAGPETLFGFLGDVFVFPPVLPMATPFSPGDAVIALGAVVFLVSAMRRRAPRPGVVTVATPAAPRS
jgi:hypothetical protein